MKISDEEIKKVMVHNKRNFNTGTVACENENHIKIMYGNYDGWAGGGAKPCVTCLKKSLEDLDKNKERAYETSTISVFSYFDSEDHDNIPLTIKDKHTKEKEILTIPAGSYVQHTTNQFTDNVEVDKKFANGFYYGIDNSRERRLSFLYNSEHTYGIINYFPNKKIIDLPKKIREIVQ